jgi:putative transposase
VRGMSSSGTNEGASSRKWLRHEMPGCISDPQPVFFLTICCRDRSGNQLAVPVIWEILLDSVHARNRNRTWHCSLFLAMPDHVHGLFTFDGHERMKSVVASWKRWTTRQAQIEWQHGFFDHRLRNSASAGEKRAYILQNPVRAGLVDMASDWPFTYDDYTDKPLSS